MLKRIALLTLVLSTLLFTCANASEAVRDRIAQELRADGYTEIRLYRTFLGRLRFIATDGRTRREIVVNPRSGVILRDYTSLLAAPSLGSSGSSSGQVSGSGSNEDGLDDDDDDDDNDDDDDDDSDSGDGDDDDSDDD